MRLDLLLKQTGLIKRRTIAKELVDLGRVLINDKVAKPSSEVKENDNLTLKNEKDNEKDNEFSNCLDFII